MTNLVIPNGVTKIGAYAFEDCKSLTSVTIGKNVTEIGDCAFENCENLTSVTILDSATEIAAIAFYHCDNIKRINIHISNLAKYCESNLMYTIDGDAHLYMNGKEIFNLVIPNGVTEIGVAAFAGCSSLTSVTIPQSVTSIGESAFCSCTKLKSITIPSKVTEIGNYAFYDCLALKSVYFKSTVPLYLGKEVFDWEQGQLRCKLYVPKSVLGRYEYADSWYPYFSDIWGY